MGPFFATDGLNKMQMQNKIVQPTANVWGYKGNFTYEKPLNQFITCKPTLGIVEVILCCTVITKLFLDGSACRARWFF